jgi:hypothetical protein
VTNPNGSGAEDDDPDYDGWDDGKLRGETVVEWLANLSSGAILVADPTGVGIMGATALEKLARAAFALDKKAHAQRVARRAEVLHLATTEMDLSIGDLIEAAGASAARTELLGRVLDAAASTMTLEAKIRALARALALGLGDEAKIDEAASIAAALDAIEVVHAKVLAALHEAFSDSDSNNVWATFEEIERMSGGLDVRGLPIMNVLVANGLARQEAGGFDGGDAGGEMADIPPIWQITRFGIAVLELLDYTPSGYMTVEGRTPTI